MKGPSFPMLIPDESIKTMPNTLAMNVLKDSTPGSFTPAIIAFTCGIPLPPEAGLINYVHMRAMTTKTMLDPIHPK